VKVWVDAQLAPSLAGWLAESFGTDAAAVSDLGLRDARDVTIFMAERSADAVVLTKDVDFVELLLRHGPPPRILWLTAGNTSNARVRELLGRAWPRILELLRQGESLIELKNQE
jgi:predicted nuclease of predicted toxin-antitoxin system